MPKEADRRYTDALRDAYATLGSPEGELSQLLKTLEELTTRMIAAIAEGEGYEDTDQRVEQAGGELQAAAAAAVGAAMTRGRERMERAHARGYTQAKEGLSIPPSAIKALPDWSPTSTGDPYKRAPFSGNAKQFVQGAIREEVEYLKQDLRYIRKYVTEDRYARAVANVLAKGDPAIEKALKKRGIDLDDFDVEDLKGRAAEVFRRTKTRGSVDIRGVLRDTTPGELQARRPQLWRRVKRNGTDSLPRILDEVAKDLAAESPAVDLVLWRLSDRHEGLRSSPDSCDVLARQDLYDFGPGLYHPRSVPSHPHANCECEIEVVTKDPQDWGKTTRERPDAFDINEKELRSDLQDLPGERSITDAHVRRVKSEIDGVVSAVHANPRT